MANIEVEAGRIPVSRGPWSSGVTVYKFNRFTYLGSEYEATADGLTNAPGSIVNNYPVANTGWRLTSVGMGEGIIESKADKDTDAVAGNVPMFDSNGNPVDSGLPIADMKNAGIIGGIADSISAGVAQEFTFRQSGGDGVNYMKRIKGKTLAWNQMVVNGNFASADGWGAYLLTQSVSNGTLTITSSNLSYPSTRRSSGPKQVSGHKYYVACDANLRSISSGMVVRVAYGDPSAADKYVGVDIDGSIANGGWKRLSSIKTLTTADNTTYYATIQGRGIGISFDCDIRNFICIDLTLLFGSGNEPATVAEFEALYPELYYPYNAGQLISNDAESIETVGFNQWDEEWLNGTYSSQTGEFIAGDGICSKNMIPIFPNTQYYIKSDSYNIRQRFYDIDGSYIGYDGQITSEGIITTPADAYYMHLCILEVSTYNHDICINLSDATRNGQYEPYWKRKIDLNLDSFKVKDKNGNIITVNGLKSAGSVYDEIVGNKYVKRVGSVDMGTLDWLYSSGSGGHFLRNLSEIGDFKQNSSYNTSPANIVCAKYENTNYADVWYNRKDKIISTYEAQKRLTIVDNSIIESDVIDGVVAKLSGVYANYELATPVEYELVKPMPNCILVDDLGTEKAVYPDHQSAPSAPFNCDSNYSISIPKLIAKLNE